MYSSFHRGEESFFVDDNKASQCIYQIAMLIFKKGCDKSSTIYLRGTFKYKIVCIFFKYCMISNITSKETLILMLKESTLSSISRIYLVPLYGSSLIFYKLSLHQNASCTHLFLDIWHLSSDIFIWIFQLIFQKWILQHLRQWSTALSFLTSLAFHLNIFFVFSSLWTYSPVTRTLYEQY